MSVHYKFKSALEYDTVTFDGLHISVKDLKNSIIQQKRIGKNTDFDLQVTNAQTKEVYEDAEALIPKNTSLLIARIPLAAQKQKVWEGYGGDTTPPVRADEGGPIAKAVDLSSLDASEDDKIRAMMSQSTQDYDPSNYMKIRGANQVGAVPPNYRCYKCHQTGHWIKDCPLSQGPDPIEIKKSTGIPRSFMVPVDGPQVQGAMMTPNGSYAVPVLDHQTYTQQKAPAVAIHEEKPEIPEDLVCSICTDLLTDAVMIPCCGNSFCDECIRSCLLESEDHECPDCHDRDISPGTLIPNRFLRNSVANFKNTTGYVKRPVYKPAAVFVEQPEPKAPLLKDPVPLIEHSKEEVKDDQQADKKPVENSEKPIISEADSTEPPKVANAVEFAKGVEVPVKTSKDNNGVIPEGPPGVSPRNESPPRPKKRNERSNTSHSRQREKPSTDPPNIHHRSRRSPSYAESLHRIEERPGTPTVDEPGMGSGPSMASNSIYPPASAPYPSGPPPGILPPMISTLGPPPHIQGPPPSITNAYSSGQPPPGVFPNPAPNYRMPPPGTAPPPFIPGPYSVPPRPLFDPTRPPMTGPPPNYSNYRGPRGRDYSSRGLRGRTPPGIIDDPLEAFNRMLREKDERERRAKQRKGRSYSRSSSRSYSRSPRRHRSRTPRRRSRSRSFSISRSRSRSFSPNRSPYREYSPRNASPRRRQPSRYRSPARSPPRYRFKETTISDRSRDRDFERDRSERDFGRDDRGFSRDREYRERDTRERPDYYYDGYERSRPKNQWPSGVNRAPPAEVYYPPEMHPPPATIYPPVNRYPPRESYPPYINKNETPHHLPPMQAPMHVHPMRRFDDVAPPGTDQPPIPGEETTPRYEEPPRYSYDRVEPPPSKDRYENVDREVNREQERRPYAEKSHDEPQRDRSRYERYSRSPARNARNPSPKPPARSKDRHETPDRHKRKKREETDKKEPEREKHKQREASDDEKAKKSRDKKKKKEKKEADKKKRKDKKERREEKHKKTDDKEKKEKSKSKDEHPDVMKDAEIQEKPVDKSEKEILEEKHEELPEPIQEEIRATTPTEIDHTEPYRNKENPEPKILLYDDVMSEGVDNNIVKNYGKLEELRIFKPERIEFKEKIEQEESEASKEFDDILDIHTNESEVIRADTDLKPEMLAPIPEKSKWEMEDEPPPAPSPIESKYEAKVEKAGKVTTEVIKRAENAIFAKAINAIRPIEIKKISVDRAKLYSGERDKKEEEVRNFQVTISSKSFEEDLPPLPSIEPVRTTDTLEQPPKRLSIKERLGCKVDDLDRVVKIDRRSRSKSQGKPRNHERRVEVEEKKDKDKDNNKDKRERDRHDSRGDRHHRNYRQESGSNRRERDNRRDNREVKDRRDVRRDGRRDYRRDDRERREDRKECSPPRGKEDKPEKRKRTRSRTPSADRRHKRRDKKVKKDKGKKKREGSEEKETEAAKEKEIKPQPTTDRRKPTLDEASFEPDYDLESESEKEEKIATKPSPPPPEVERKRVKVEEKKKEKESSSSDSSSSSSEDERKKKKHKKHKKKKSRKESSSSSSDSDSDSSEEEHKKRKKHKKKSKRRKKSKHK